VERNQFSAQIKASIVFGVKELLQVLRTLPSMLNADFDATIDIA